MKLEELENIILKDEHYEKMLNHSKSKMPFEAVGMVAGYENGKAVITLPLINEMKEKNSFFVNPYSQYEVFKKIQELHLTPLALYHSHPDGLPLLSESDIYFALRHQLIQIIISFSTQKVNTEVIKAFIVYDSDYIKEIPILITEN